MLPPVDYQYTYPLTISSSDKMVLEGLCAELREKKIFIEESESTSNTPSSAQNKQPTLPAFFKELDSAIEKNLSKNKALSVQQNQERDLFYYYFCYYLMNIFQEEIKTYKDNFISLKLNQLRAEKLSNTDQNELTTGLQHATLASLEADLRNLFSALTIEQESGLDSCKTGTWILYFCLLVASLAVFFTLTALSGGAAIPVYIGLGVFLGTALPGLAIPFTACYLYEDRKQTNNATRNDTAIKSLQHNLGVFGTTLKTSAN